MKTTTPTIHQINISGGGVPKFAIAEGKVTKAGLEGDRHARPNIHGGPMRALSLLGLDVIEKLASAGHPIAPGSSGENLSIEGLDWAQLEPGMRLRLGEEVLIEIQSYATPCATIAGSFRDGDITLLSHVTAPGQSRLYASVLEEGTLRSGDPVAVLAEKADAVRATGPVPKAAGPVSEANTSASRQPGLRLGYINLYVGDLDRSLAFFTETLGIGLQFADKSFGYASLDSGPLRMGLAQIDISDPQFAGFAGRQTGIGFAVDDLMAAHRMLEERGVKFRMKPTKQPWGGFMAMFEDPDGNVFYLDQYVEH
jgi:MOSC domain-containing protein YiiM/catechol 2,3-dioxygenase-like lactoylglutathione lyase family enzyme